MIFTATKSQLVLLLAASWWNLITSLITRFMGPTGPRCVPCWPHDLCYLSAWSVKHFGDSVVSRATYIVDSSYAENNSVAQNQSWILRAKRWLAVTHLKWYIRFIFRVDNTFESVSNVANYIDIDGSSFEKDTHSWISMLLPSSFDNQTPNSDTHELNRNQIPPFLVCISGLV